MLPLINLCCYLKQSRPVTATVSALHVTATGNHAVPNSHLDGGGTNGKRKADLGDNEVLSATRVKVIMHLSQICFGTIHAVVLLQL